MSRHLVYPCERSPLSFRCLVCAAVVARPLFGPASIDRGGGGLNNHHQLLGKRLNCKRATQASAVLSKQKLAESNLFDPPFSERLLALTVELLQKPFFGSSKFFGIPPMPTMPIDQSGELAINTDSQAKNHFEPGQIDDRAAKRAALSPSFSCASTPSVPPLGHLPADLKLHGEIFVGSKNLTSGDRLSSVKGTFEEPELRL